jgi:hypothetical protein
MFNQKWEKERLLSSDYPGRFDRFCLLACVPTGKFVGARQCLVLGTVLVFSGWSLGGITPLALGGGHPMQIMPVGDGSQRSIINVSSDPTPAPSKASAKSTEAGTSSKEPTASPSSSPTEPTGESAPVPPKASAESTEAGTPSKEPTASPSSSPTEPTGESAPVPPKASAESAETGTSSEDPPDSPKLQQKVLPPHLEKPTTLIPEHPDEDNGQAMKKYKAKMEETRTLMRIIDESKLTKEQHDTFHSINSFLEKAQEAISQDDMSMAVNLVEKAHTLIREIVKNHPQP